MSEPGKKGQQRRDEKKEEMEKNEDRETKRWKQAPPIARYFQKGNIQDIKTSKAFIEGVFLYRPFAILSLNEA